MTLSEKLQQIISQSEEATPGPWKQHGIQWNATMCEHFTKITSGEAPSDSQYSRPVTVGYFRPCDFDQRPFDQDVQQELPMEANAAFIASSRSLVPALARALGVAVEALSFYESRDVYVWPDDWRCRKEGGPPQLEDCEEASEVGENALAEIEKLLEVK